MALNLIFCSVKRKEIAYTVLNRVRLVLLHPWSCQGKQTSSATFMVMSRLTNQSKALPLIL